MSGHAAINFLGVVCTLPSVALELCSALLYVCIVVYILGRIDRRVQVVPFVIGLLPFWSMKWDKDA